MIQTTGKEKVSQRARLKSKNKRRSLGAEWKMSEFGISPPHNSDNPHALVVRINNNNMKFLNNWRSFINTANS